MYTLSACGAWFDGDEADKIYAAHKNGFKALELLLWNNADLGKMKKALDDTGMTISALLVQSKTASKQALIENSHGIVWEDARDAFVDAVGETLEAANQLGVKTIVINSGNERSDVSREHCHNVMVETICAAAKVVENTDVQLVLEPLNILVDHPGYYLVTTAEGIETVHEVNHPNVKLLFDVYHQQISEGNIIRNLTENIGYIGHIHIADNPGRLEPGTGEINYKNVFKAIEKTDYNGYVVFECGRSEDADKVCAKMLALAE